MDFDDFEWRLTRRSLVALCGFFVVLLSAAVISQIWPGQVQYRQGLLVALARSLGLAVALAGLVVALRLPVGSRALRPLAYLVLGANLGATLANLFWSEGNLVVSQAGFLVSSTLYLALFGFFSRSAGATLALGLGFAALAWWVFVQTPERWFPQVLTVDALAGALNVVVAFGLPMATFLIYTNHRVASSLRARTLESADRLARLAYYDAETDLPNGVRLEKDLAEWRPSGLVDGAKIALAGFRLEGLGPLNERQGLEATTEVLRRVALAFRDGLVRGLEANPSFLAPEGWKPMYRVEGGTFAVPFTIPPGTKPDPTPLVVLLAGALDEANLRLRPGPGLRFAGGFTVFPDDTPVPRQLLANLLNLLYSGRGAGDGVFLPFNRAHYDEHVRREALVTALAAAPDDGSYATVFQPKVRLADQAVVGFEALARWRHPTLGPVSPAEFVPLAERSDQIAALTWRTLDDSQRFLADWLASGRDEVRVSINLSPALLNARFLGALHDRLEASGDAGSLEFEITEGTLMVVNAEAQAHFHRLRALGVVFSIDDFGTGYSNLGYLQNFEAEVLKIDKRFVDGIPHNDKSTKLIEAILLMARSFRMKVVAEGVEYREQREVLARLGCDQVQGYLYAKPLSRAEALAFEVVTENG